MYRCSGATVVSPCLCCGSTIHVAPCIVLNDQDLLSHIAMLHTSGSTSKNIAKSCRVSRFWRRTFRPFLRAAALNSRTRRCNGCGGVPPNSDSGCEYEGELSICPDCYYAACEDCACHCGRGCGETCRGTACHNTARGTCYCALSNFGHPYAELGYISCYMGARGGVQYRVAVQGRGSPGAS